MAVYALKQNYTCVSHPLETHICLYNPHYAHVSRLTSVEQLGRVMVDRAVAAACRLIQADELFVSPEADILLCDRCSGSELLSAPRLRSSALPLAFLYFEDTGFFSPHCRSFLNAFFCCIVWHKVLTLSLSPHAEFCFKVQSCFYYTWKIAHKRAKHENPIVFEPPSWIWMQEEVVWQRFCYSLKFHKAEGTIIGLSNIKQ